MTGGVSLHPNMIKAMATVLPTRAALMVVGPLTSSREIHFATGDAERERLRRRNEQAITALAERLRAEQNLPVINPTTLVVEGWSLDDYRRFFLDVLAHFVCRVYFVSGWEYSEGVTAEFLLCRRYGIDCRQENGAALSAAHAEELLRAAAGHLQDAGMRFAWMTDRVAALDSPPSLSSLVDDQ